MIVDALSVGVALASEPAPVVAVMPGLAGDDEEAIREALARAGYRHVTLSAPDTFAARMDVVSVTSRTDDDCGGAVDIDDWRRALDRARDGFQMLDFSASLSQLVGLEVELVCMSSPLAASDMLRLELAVAEAHTWLAQASDGDSARFHQDEADAALRRAAVVGATLATPAEVSPDVLAAWDEVRRQVADRERPRVVVAGPGARVGARFDGRPIPEGAFDAVEGVNVVQAADGVEVDAAAIVRLDARSRTLLWLAPGGATRTPRDVLQAVVALSDGGAGEEQQALLAAAAHLVDDEATVVYVTLGEAGEQVWRAEGARLVRVEGAVASPGVPEVDRWRFALGLGAGGGWSSLGEGDLEGLGGPNLGPALFVRVGVTPLLSVAFTTHPSAVAAPVPEEQGGGALFRATVPVRAGVRLSAARDRRIRPEAGLDVGGHYLGVFDGPRLSLLVVGSLGVTGAVGPTSAVRVEAFGGGGLGYGVVGAFVGVEWRQ